MIFDHGFDGFYTDFLVSCRIKNQRKSVKSVVKKNQNTEGVVNNNLS